jgi:hypothetical protein
MMTSHATATDRIEVVPLTPTTWRVCDPNFDEGTPGRIVGYITTEQDGFEMLWMRPRPGVMYRYDTFDGAVEATETRMRLLRR